MIQEHMTGGFADSKSSQMGGELISLFFFIFFGGGERDCLNSA